TRSLIFLLLFSLSGFGFVEFGIEMARCKQDPFAVGRKIAASCPTSSGADSLRPAAVQRLCVNLIKRIIQRLSLIDNLLAVRRKIALASFHEATGDLADVRQELAFDRILGACEKR